MDRMRGRACERGRFPVRGGGSRPGARGPCAPHAHRCRRPFDRRRRLGGADGRGRSREREGVTYAAITGWGMAVPPHALSNADLARSVPEIDEDWIVRRTGILQRHVAGPEDTTSTLSARAGRWALARAGIDPEQLDVIIVATCTPDTPIPATAPRVQAAIGASRAGAFDVNAACAGFLTALGSAH